MFDWMRNQFNPSLETSHVLLKGKEELAELINDRTVQIKCNELYYNVLHKKRIYEFNKISTFRDITIFNKIAFSELNEIKNKKRERLMSKKC
jgi:hypothetical protein